MISPLPIRHPSAGSNDELPTRVPSFTGRDLSKVEGSVAGRPDGLLLHETLFYSFFPLHVGMRQYWRDFESLERFTRTEPHREWWKQFLRDTGGTGFWHELYSVRGGFESIY
jgi:Domain of unknown function (DUF4188)